MPTNYFNRQGILQQVLRRLFNNDETIVEVESSDTKKDQSLFYKMLVRRGINNSVTIAREEKKVIFKMK